MAPLKMSEVGGMLYWREIYSVLILVVCTPKQHTFTASLRWQFYYHCSSRICCHWC